MKMFFCPVRKMETRNQMSLNFLPLTMRNVYGIEFMNFLSFPSSISSYEMQAVCCTYILFTSFSCHILLMLSF